MSERVSALWQFFTKDPKSKIAQCLYCPQALSLKKSSYANLRRHILRKHPSLENFIVPRVNTLGATIWKHYIKEPGKRARCKHCCKDITYKYTTYSLRRHIRNKHPAIDLDEGNESERRSEQTSDSPYDSSDSSNRCLASPKSVVSEHDTKLFDFLEVDDNELGEPVQIEVINFDPESKSIMENQDLIQELPHHTDSIIQYDQSSLTNNDSDQGDDMGQVIEETVIGTIIDPSSIADPSTIIDPNIIVEQCVETKPVKSKPKETTKNKDICKKAAAFATHTALEMDSLARRQRIIAEKLISEVLYHAKLENLTEYSMLVVRVGTFEKERFC
uniref:BED-type domain-containing protein n=1 Tax=Anopheles farauti TaxID=69004 RepID=A0A182Q8L5_9DIPT